MVSIDGVFMIPGMSSWCIKGKADPKGWSTVLVTALGSWEKTVYSGVSWCIKMYSLFVDGINFILQ
jgi:hypothetical protein